MGEFIEAGEGDNPSSVTSPQPKVFTSDFITAVIKKSLEKGDIPPDHKLAFIGAVDEKGARAVISVQIADRPVFGEHHLHVKVQSIVEHEWTGDNKAGAQVLFSVR